MTDAAGRLAVAALALLGFAAPSSARPLTPEQAPQAWVRYAQDATDAITACLNGADPQAVKVREAISGVGEPPEQPLRLIVAVWVDRTGTLSRVDCAGPGSAQPDQDVRHLLVGRRLAPPPKRMRQPLRLALHLQPRPAPGDAAARPLPAAPGDNLIAAHSEISR